MIIVISMIIIINIIRMIIIIIILNENLITDTPAAEAIWLSAPPCVCHFSL